MSESLHNDHASIVAQQRRLNNDTQNDWQDFANHRDRVTSLAVAAAESLTATAGSPRDLPTLCVLGAGNGNDLELARLTQSYSKVHLLDLDADSLQRIEQRYGDEPAILQRLQFEAGVDLTGVAQKLQQFPNAATEPQAIELITAARACDVALPSSTTGPFDVVLSTCLLTQLIDSVLQTLGPSNPFLLPVTIAIRDGHLGLVKRLQKPHGRGVLVTDFVSSDTLPLLKTTKDDESVLALSRQAIEQRNFFTGANPFSIRQALVEVAAAANENAVSVAPPWHWQLGDRCYLVTALSF